MTLFFGPAGIPTTCRDHKEALERISAMGLNALEVEFVHGVRMRPLDAAAIGALAAGKGVRLSAHAPYYINLNSRDPAIVERSQERLLETMCIARDLGARVIVVHAGFYSGMAPSEATRVMTEQVGECRERADAEGCEKVAIGLETMGKRASWGTLPEIRKVSSEVKGVFPVMDFAHLHARGRGALSTTGAFRDVLEEFERFGAPFMHCHFSGVEFGPSGERRHLELRARSPDFALLAPLLLKKRYDVTVICESPLLQEDALLMKAMVEEAKAGAERRQPATGSRQKGTD